MGQNKSQFQEYRREQKLKQNNEKIHGLTKVLMVTSEHGKMDSGAGFADQEKSKVDTTTSLFCIGRVAAMVDSLKTFKEDVVNVLLSRCSALRGSQSMKMLKNVFSQLDPSVIHHGGIDNGSVELSLKFVTSKSLLLVRIECCKDLRSRDLRSRACNPYVKLWLIPDIDQQGEKHTDTSLLTCNPVYKELFAFKLSPELLQTAQIFLEVWDQDVNERDEFLGQSLVQLSDHDLQDNCLHTAWTSLEIKRDLHVTGVLEISLTYEELVNGEEEERVGPKLSISVHQLTGLTALSESQELNVAVKIAIPGTLYSFRTETKSGTTNIVVDETFECKVPSKDFNKRFILFDVLDLSGLAERSLGQVIVPLGNFDPEQSFSDSFPLEDLTNCEIFQEKLAQDPATQELRGALQAHAMVANPSFIFQKPAGNKIITLTARKAGSQARIRILDGIPVY